MPVGGADHERLRALGALVRQYRVERNWTVRDMAARAHVAAGTVSHLENGRHLPTQAVFARIVAALDIDDAMSTSLWCLWRAARNEPSADARSVDPASVMRTIHQLSELLHRAWQRGDGSTARMISGELEGLWVVYRAALAARVH